MKTKKENLFMRLFNRILKLSYLKAFELAIGFVKGFSVKIEFFEKKNKRKFTKEELNGQFI